MPAGRPRTVTPEPEELEKLGKELLEWASKPLEEGEFPGHRCRFAQWYSLLHNILDKEWEYMIVKPEFKGYYEKARVHLSNRFIQSGHEGQIKEKLAHRFMHTYFPETRKEDYDKVEHVVRVKKRLEEEQEKGKCDELNNLKDAYIRLQYENDKLKKQCGSEPKAT